MTSLAPAQVAAIQDLRQVFNEVPLVLVGASALVCQFGGWKPTRDLDMTVAVSVDELRQATTQLPGWRRHPTREHEWLSRDGVPVDLLPAGPEILAAGEVVWPESGRRMNMRGFRLAIEWIHTCPVVGLGDLRVAPVPVIVILKILAFLDQPYDRHHDLRDIATIWDQYEISGDRRFNDDARLAGIAYEQVGAFLIGQELAPRLLDEERQVMERFLDGLLAPTDAFHSLERMTQRGPSYLRDEPDFYRKCAQAMQLGIAVA